MSGRQKAETATYHELIAKLPGVASRSGTGLVKLLPTTHGSESDRLYEGNLGLARRDFQTPILTARQRLDALEFQAQTTPVSLLLDDIDGTAPCHTSGRPPKCPSAATMSNAPEKKPPATDKVNLRMKGTTQFPAPSRSCFEQNREKKPNDALETSEYLCQLPPSKGVASS